MIRPRKPNLFIVGSQKSGTSSLKNWLNQHPDIRIDVPLEPNIFADDVEGCEDYKDMEWYLSLFPKNAKEKYIGEKSARYLYSMESAKRIKKFNPKAKIIIILRNPAEMIYSLYNHLRKQGLEPIGDFHRALEKEEERKKIYGEEFRRNFFYKSAADYYPQVKRYINEFGKKNTKVVILEEIKENPQKVYDEIIHFLKVKKFKPKFRIINVGDQKLKNNFYVWVYYFLQNIPKPVKKSIKKIFPLQFRNTILKTSLKKVDHKGNIDELTKNKINDYFRENVKNLGKLIEKDLSGWYK